MTSHEVDYRIFGDDIQFVEIDLDPNETIVAEAGTMVYMEQGITYETRMGDGASPDRGMMDKLFQAGSRILTGESLFLTHFTNRGSMRSKVAFAAPYPGTIIPIDLRTVNGNIIVQKDGFLCAAYGTKLSVTLNRKLGAGLLGGEGFILQRLETMVFGGEGLFLATMRGTGKVWLQSMPIRKLIRALSPMGANRGKEAQGLLGNLFQ
jgi:uncharacterized protein (AIM24 family)